MTGFRNLIRVEGRDFFNLSPIDAADMIDAFLAGGDAKYDYAALPEFMLVPNQVAWLEELRSKVKSIDDNHRSGDEPDGLASQNGRDDLASLSSQLRKRDEL